MEEVNIYLERLIGMMGMNGDYVPTVRYGLLVILAFALAWLVGWVCRRFLIPILLKITRRTDVKWDDVLFSERVLLSASHIVPAIVIWALLPLVFYEYPRVEDIVGRLTAIFFTVMMVRTIIVFIDSFKLLESGTRSSRQQYLYSICGVLKILIIFISVIVVIAIIINKNPTTLFAGLGAVSAILMLAFQDIIKGLVAGIRLTANDMLHIGDWITEPKSGANGKVEEITLKQVKRVYFDFRSIKVEHPDNEAMPTTNITRFRHHMEQWLSQNPKVVSGKSPLVKQAETPQASGCCLEFMFWLKAKDALAYEHDTSDIMEYIYGAASEYGLTIYQPAQAAPGVG